MSNTRNRAISVGVAVLSTVVCWVIAKILDIDLVIDPRNGQEPGALALPFAAVVTLVVALLGWGLRLLLDRLTRKAATVWAVIAVVVLLLSLVPVFGVGATVGTRVILTLMHVSVAAILLPSFGRPAPSR